MLRSLTNLNASNHATSPYSVSSEPSLHLYPANMNPFGNYRMHITRDREKAENALFEHVRKAVNSQETAPKQKHVRGKIIVMFLLYSSIV